MLWFYRQRTVSSSTTPRHREGRYPGRPRVGLPMEFRTLKVEVPIGARLPSRC